MVWLMAAARLAESVRFEATYETVSSEVSFATSAATSLAAASLMSETTTCAPFFASMRATSRPMPLPPPTMSAILRREFGFGRHALQLGFFERPVFDFESFGAGKRDVVMGRGEVLRTDARGGPAGAGVRHGSSSSAAAPAIT